MQLEWVQPRRARVETMPLALCTARCPTNYWPAITTQTSFSSSELSLGIGWGSMHICVLCWALRMKKSRNNMRSAWKDPRRLPFVQPQSRMVKKTPPRAMETLSAWLLTSTSLSQRLTSEWKYSSGSSRSKMWNTLLVKLSSACCWEDVSFCRHSVVYRRDIIFIAPRKRLIELIDPFDILDSQERGEVLRNNNKVGMLDRVYTLIVYTLSISLHIWRCKQSATKSASYYISRNGKGSLTAEGHLD